MEKTIKSIAANFGLYLGLALSAITVFSYAVSLEFLTKWYAWILLLILPIIFGIISISKSKYALNGFISFKSAFTSYFLTILIGISISTIVSVLIFNVIDPDAAIQLKEKMIEGVANFMRGLGAPENQVVEAVEEMRNQPNNFSFSALIQEFVKNLLVFSVIGLIIALIMKKADDNA